MRAAQRTCMGEHGGDVFTAPYAMDEALESTFELLFRLAIDRLGRGAPERFECERDLRANGGHVSERQRCSEQADHLAIGRASISMDERDGIRIAPRPEVGPLGEFVEPSVYERMSRSGHHGWRTFHEARLDAGGFRSCSGSRSRDHMPLSDDLCIHVLELPKLPCAPTAAEASPVLRWGRFFAAKTDAELEQLAMIDLDLKRAKTAIERLSADPAAQELARERELAVWNYERGLRLAHKEGKVEGERTVLRRLLSRKFGELPESVRDRLERASAEELERWSEQLLNASSLEEALF